MGFWPGLGRPLHRLLRAGPPLAAPTSPLLSEVLTRGPGSARSFLVVHASLSPGSLSGESRARIPEPWLPCSRGGGPGSTRPACWPDSAPEDASARWGWGPGGLPSADGGQAGGQHVREGGRGLEASSAVSQQGHPVRPSPPAASAVARFRAGKRRGGLGGLVGERVGSWSRRAAGPVALEVARARIGRTPRREGWRGKEGAGVRAAASQVS